MYGEIHEHEPTTRRAKVHRRVPTVDQHRGMMIPMQEYERLFAQHDEYRIAKLRQFAEHEQPRPAAGYAVRVVTITHRVR